MSIKAKMICDSISEEDIRLSTIQVTIPKFLLAQLNTHRMFSRNAASSRAIPTSKVIERVKIDPVFPLYWGKNRSGMNADEEITSDDRFWAEYSWERASRNAAESAEELRNTGVHKQITNRLLEPFMYVDVLITATEWQNFFDLRLHDSTQPEMREVARVMRNIMDFSTPEVLENGEWHLPYVSPHEKTGGLGNKIKCSVARCARVSYLNHDQSNTDLKKDLALYDMLLRDKHFSPFEHQAFPMRKVCFFSEDGLTHIDRDGKGWSGNLRGWSQYRQMI